MYVRHYGTLTDMSVERWVTKARDAAIEAVSRGASPDEVWAAVEAGIAEGLRLAAIRRGTAPTPRRESEPTRHVDPDSAVGRLLSGTA